MVFETSCWATGGYMSQGDDNSVQRRSKIDYFDTNCVRSTPIISHISSNGYYGYCPTPTINPTSTEIDVNNGATMDSSNVDFPMNAPAATAAPSAVQSISMHYEQVQHDHNHHHQLQHQGQTIDKRKRTKDQCNYVIDTKRRRNCFSDDCIEGLYPVDITAAGEHFHVLNLLCSI